MKNKRQAILDAARELFNAHGIATVTIRQIAQHLGISSGNLNYHFKKREEILHALYFEMVAMFDARLEALPQQKISLSLIYQQMKTSMEQMLDYSFIWTELPQLLRQDKAINQHFRKVYQQRIDGYAYLFEQLIAQGLMQTEAYAHQHQALAMRMVHYSDTWLSHLALYDQPLRESLQQQLHILLGTLYPYLSAKGQEELRGILGESMLG